jgi:predicted permease
MFTLLVAAFGIVLLVACANVTNLLIARGFGRQREFGVRLALGANRGRIVRQLIVEGLVLAVPAAVVGLVLTMVTAHLFPWLIITTIPSLLASSIADVLAPMAPDLLVLTVLVAAAVGSAVLVSVAPAMRLARLDLVRVSKGEMAGDAQRSRLRAGLVALQIGACALFLVVARGLMLESRQMANPDTGFSYERVADVRVAPSLRATLADRLALDPEVEHVAAAWEPPLSGPLPQVKVVASRTGIERPAGFMVVSPGYFPLFDIQVLRGRMFTAGEAAGGEPLALVSAATARAFWPGLDPIGQTLDLSPTPGPGRRPEHPRVRVIGVTEDVANGMLGGGLDPTCIYFATDFAPAGGLSVLVSGRTTTAAIRTKVAAAAAAIDPTASFQFFALRDMVGGQAWVFSAFSAGASFLGLLGLLLACSGTYAVVSFLVTQRKREFGIRMALGATVPQIVSSILHDTLRTASIGLGLGLAAALALVSVLAANVEIIDPFGPAPFLIAAAIVLGATTVAATWPSLRAARVDPARALRVD